MNVSAHGRRWVTRLEFSIHSQKNHLSTKRATVQTPPHQSEELSQCIFRYLYNANTPLSPKNVLYHASHEILCLTALPVKI